MRCTLAVGGVVLVLGAAWLIQMPPPPAAIRPPQASLSSPTAAEESGEDPQVAPPTTRRASPVQRRPATRSDPAPGDVPAHTAVPSTPPPAAPAPPPDAAATVSGPPADAAPGVPDVPPDEARTPSSPGPPVVTPPVLLSSPTVYPDAGYQAVVDRNTLTPEARVIAAEGRVTLRILVRSDGSVGEVEIAVPSGSAVLDEAAVRAAREWRFDPAMRDGMPIESWALIPVRFDVP